MCIRSVRSIGLSVFLCALSAAPAWGINAAIPAVGGDISRAQLGDGTGVIIGILDSGVDDLHPALAGLDSQGNPRMVAEKNHTSEIGNTGDDTNGHGTFISSVALSRDATNTGMAPDARYVNSRVLDSSAVFAGTQIIQEGMSFAINNGADILNMPLNFDRRTNPSANGSSQLDLMIDWAADELGISCVICAGNIVQATDGSQQVRAPASAYNGITVGRTTPDTSRVHSDSATAFTVDGRMKPDLVAPGTGLTVARHNWEGAAADWVNLNDNVGGCSLAVPMVAGMLAQQIEGGRLHGLSTDPLVVKATIMNSAQKVNDKSNAAWQPHTSSLVNDVYTATRPLDDQSGAGQIDGAALAEQYLAGEMGPGLIESIGWDLHTIGGGQSIDYVIDPNLMFGSVLTTTLTWYRHVTRTDGGLLGVIDSGDFFVAQALSNLNLQVLRNGELFAQSMSALDNVEHLRLALGDTPAQYTLRVLNLSNNAEQFALAWHGIAVPEPVVLPLALASLMGIAFGWRRR
jgi:hypothetical protein